MLSDMYTEEQNTDASGYATILAAGVFFTVAIENPKVIPYRSVFHFPNNAYFKLCFVIYRPASGMPPIRLWCLYDLACYEPNR